MSKQAEQTYIQTRGNQSTTNQLSGAEGEGLDENYAIIYYEVNVTSPTARCLGLLSRYICLA